MSAIKGILRGNVDWLQAIQAIECLLSESQPNVKQSP